MKAVFTPKDRISMQDRKSRFQHGINLAAAPTPQIGTKIENGIEIKVYAPGYAHGEMPSKGFKEWSGL